MTPHIKRLLGLFHHRVEAEGGGVYYCRLDTGDTVSSR